MNDRQLHFTISGTLASVLAVAALLLAAACFVFDSLAIGFLGVHCAIGSALFRVRTWVCTLGGRERDAFEMGRESTRIQRVK